LKKIRYARQICLILIICLLMSISALGMEPITSEQSEKLSQILTSYEQLHISHPKKADMLSLFEKNVSENPELTFDQQIFKLLNDFDPYNYYFATGEEYRNAFFSKSFIGIGITMVKYGSYMKIASVLDGPAKKSGIIAGDIIAAVDGTDIKDFPADKVKKLITGKANTIVILDIIRNGARQKFQVIRKEISPKSIEYTITEGNIGYIKISNFDNLSVYKEFYSALTDLYENKKLRGFIFDLRDNHGGDTRTCLNMLNLLFSKEDIPLINFVWSSGEKTTPSTGGEGIDLPATAILVNQNTASAAEIFSGVLQDYSKGVLIGEITTGKGCGQNHIELPDGSWYTVTVLDLALPKSGTYHGVGLIPDIQVSNSAASFPIPDLFPLSYNAGQTENNIKALKQRLGILSYYNGRIDSKKDDALTLAIASFCKEHDIAEKSISAPLFKAVDNAITELSKKTVYMDYQMMDAVYQVKKQLRNYKKQGESK
jgi:carboxyl-terminal processing protease